jgi:hypothetical protein
MPLPRRPVIPPQMLQGALQGAANPNPYSDWRHGPDKIYPFGFYIDNPYDRTMGDLNRWDDREIDLMPYRLIPSGPVIDMPNYYPPMKGVPLFDPGEAVSIERSI